MTYFFGGPPHLYKYLAMPRAGDSAGEAKVRDILIAHNFFLSDPQSLGDPYECPPGADPALRVFCLAKRSDSVLMWSRYAEHHTGFALRFVTKDPLIAEATPVEYATSRRMADPRARGAPDKRKALLLKSRDWKYEEEYRIVRPAASDPMLPFNPAALTSVIFGIAMPEADKARVRGWCAEGGLNVKFYQASDDRSSFSVGMTEAG